jgi:hypothetical protein
MENMEAKSLTDARARAILSGAGGSNFLARGTVTTDGGSMRNHGLKVLGLALLSALSMMAFAVAGAQAQLPGESKLGKFSVNGVAPTEDPLKGEQLGSGYLLVQARDLKIECAEGTVDSAVANNETDAKATVTFKKCVANNHKGEPLKDCLFKELETVKASALALPVLHGGERFVLFEPLSGTQFANVSFKPETVCTLPLNNPVTGSVVAKVGELEGTSLPLEFSEAVQLLSGDVLKYGALANTSYVNAKAHVAVEGGGTLGVH